MGVDGSFYQALLFVWGNPMGMFPYRVIKPARYGGTYENPIVEIEMLERKNDGMMT